MRELARVCCVAVLIGLCTRGWSAELITCDFSRAPAQPWLQVTGDARVEEGVLKSAPQANWQRSGLTVGPLPVADAVWTVEYDFRPVEFGRQCQEFVSQSPSTHWYMVYVRPDGRVNLHTRAGGEWQHRASSEQPVELDEWYHVMVTLAATGVRYVVRERDAGENLWDSGEVAMDAVGPETLFALVDEAPDTIGKTHWDNLAVSTDDPTLIDRMSRMARELERRRQEQERQEATARQLRQAGIALIPTSQHIRLDRGVFDLSGRTVIVPDPNHPGAREDAEMVRGVVAERLGLDLPIGTDGPAGLLTLSYWPDDRPSPWRGEQGYRLMVRDSGAEILASAPVGFFYGAQTLCQLAGGERRVPRCRITDWPAIENRLVMIAVSQGAFQVIDVEYWKRIIRELAAVKVNYIMPYFEGGTFYYEKYPFLGVKGRDGFTIEKGRTLSEYARQHFIQLVPQQEALGHSGNILCHEELEDLRESGGVFCPSNPRTFEFLGDLFDELVQAFPDASYIHVGGDEFAHGFAKCPLCQQRAEEIGKPALYAEHMMKLRDLLQQRSRKMMIWWHEQGYTEEAADGLARDIVVFDWHYGNQASYPSLERLQSKGFSEVWATPAVTRYYGGRNDWDNTFGNISGFLREAVERRVPGECTCTWVHGIWGGRNLFELNFYGLLFSAQCAWNPLPADYADFRWRFGRHWFGLDGEELEQQVLQAVHAPYGEGPEQKFWADNRAMEPMLAAPLAETSDEIQKRPDIVEEARELLAFCTRASGILEQWQRAATRNRITADFLAHDVHIHATLARRILAVKALLDAYERATKLEAEQRAAELAPSIESLRALAKDYQQIQAGFDRSVLEAGGGKCGWGSWWPFVATGGIQFRVAEGMAAVERQIEHLTQILQGETLPEDPFAR